jgi:hypothetical protein
MPVSTVGAMLRRLGLSKLAVLAPRPAVIRYERQRPGELIHLDTKKLGRIAGIGHRITTAIYIMPLRKWPQFNTRVVSS